MSLGLTVEEAMSCPKMMSGSGSEIVHKLRKLREDAGINYFSFGLNDTESISEFNELVMRPLRRER